MILLFYYSAIAIWSITLSRILYIITRYALRFFYISYRCYLCPEFISRECISPCTGTQHLSFIEKCVHIMGFIFGSTNKTLFHGVSSIRINQFRIYGKEIAIVESTEEKK